MFSLWGVFSRVALGMPGGTECGRSFFGVSVAFCL